MRAWLLMASIGFSGCIPLPAALPPARAAMTIAPAIGNPLPDTDGTPFSEVEGMAIGRVGVVIQSLWPEQNRRVVEVEAGYAFQLFLFDQWQMRNRHGGFLGISVLLGHFWLGENWRTRIVLRGAGEMFGLQGLPGWGGGGSWAVGIEIAKFESVDEENEGPIRFLGWLAGEWSVGVEVFGGVYSVAGADYGTVGLALTGRWPGLFGIALIPLGGSL